MAYIKSLSLNNNITSMFTAPFFLKLKRAISVWLAVDAPVLIYMIKATIAGILALIVSMELNMSDPRTAIFTTFIVMQPQSGLVFSKSYYRVLGTIVGVGVSLLLMGFFAQQREWFIGAFALWIGLCTAAGFKFRNFQAYGFVLAGYTLCIVALPVIEMPLEIFNIAVSRFSEVIIGIMSATLVSDVLFPRKLSDSLLSMELERFKDIVATLADKERLFSDLSDPDANIARFSNGAVGLNAIRINSSFESGYDQKTRRHASRLNQEYMNLSTTFHSFKKILFATRSDISTETLETIQKLYDPIVGSLKQLPLPLVEQEGMEHLIEQLAHAKKEIKAVYADERFKRQLDLDTKSYDPFISMSALLVRLADELYIYTVIYLSFIKHKRTANSSKELSRVVRFATHTDNMLVALAAIRGSGVLLLSMAFWILSGWPYATLSITLAVVISLLIGTLPRPLDAVMNFFKGGLSAVAVAALYDFYIIPELTSDILTLCLVIAPVLAVVAWLTTLPKWSGFSLGFIFLFMYQCAFDPYYKVDPTVFLESTLAYLIGIVFAGSAYMLVNFWSASLTQKRVAKVLRQELSELCKGALHLQRSSLESTGRDLVQQFSTHGRLNERSSRLVFEWLLSTLEIGRSIITIRKNMKRIGYSYRSHTLRKFLDSLKEYFEKPTGENEKRVLERLQEALTVMKAKEIYMEQKDLKRVEIIMDELSLLRTVVANKASLPIYKEDICP